MTEKIKTLRSLENNAKMFSTDWIEQYICL